MLGTFGRIQPHIINVKTVGKGMAQIADKVPVCRNVVNHLSSTIYPFGTGELLILSVIISLWLLPYLCS